MKNVLAVLSSGYSPDDAGKVTDSVTIDRATAASLLTQSMAEQYNPFDIVIFCGGRLAGQDYPSVAFAMAEYFMNLPTTPAGTQFKLEDKSLDTVENAKGARAVIVDQYGIANTNIYLVTSGSHLVRAGFIFDTVMGKSVIKYSSGELLAKAGIERRCSLLQEIRTRTLEEAVLTPILIALSLPNRRWGLNAYQKLFAKKAAARFDPKP